VKRQFNTDCEGPISKNDNAFELAQEFMPRGGELFAKLSKYDDVLADIDRKPGYKAGDTLRLILPFFKAYDITDAGIREFSSQNVLLVPGADIALKKIQSIMPTFIISTSYRPYISALCDLIDFPPENTYCTELSLDRYHIPDSEVSFLKELHGKILALPLIEIPPSAASREDLDAGSLECIDVLDGIFWEEFPGMACGKPLEDVNPVGGFEKAAAIRRSCEKTGVELSEVMYVGDSITDAEAMKLVREAGGMAVSFNGNRYAIESSDVACISPNAMILMVLASIFEKDGTGSIRDLASEWDSRKSDVEESMGMEIAELSVELIENADLEELVTRSESFRKTVRGERIGRLG
jgi:energy-converting hydrogenase A subunit R